MKLTKEDYMKLGLERCAELLVEMNGDDSPTTYTYRTCPYTGLRCYKRFDKLFDGCFNCTNNPSSFTTTTSKED